VKVKHKITSHYIYYRAVSEMTYTVSSGTLNPTIPYLLPCWWTWKPW